MFLTSTQGFFSELNQPFAFDKRFCGARSLYNMGDPLKETNF